MIFGTATVPSVCASEAQAAIITAGPKEAVHGFSECYSPLCKAPKVSIQNSFSVPHCRLACALSCFSRTACSFGTGRKRSNSHRSSFTAVQRATTASAQARQAS